jgi:hypothetical protein
MKIYSSKLIIIILSIKIFFFICFNINNFSISEKIIGSFKSSKNPEYSANSGECSLFSKYENKKSKHEFSLKYCFLRAN